MSRPGPRTYQGQNQGLNYSNSNLDTVSYKPTSTGGFDRSSARRASIPPGAEPPKSQVTEARFGPTDSFGQDWRVKISVPSFSTFRSSPVLAPLASTGYNVVFPLTPQISMISSAAYDQVAPTHSNYPFPAYMNSRTEEFTIAGEFPVQNPEDARYWNAVVHFGRSITKMAYGETSNKGAPPPICKVNGYGAYVLNNVPVVITSFNLTLENSVDYIETTVNGESQWAPTNSNLSFTCMPIYSRTKVAAFSLDAFINGSLKDQGYI